MAMQQREIWGLFILAVGTLAGFLFLKRPRVSVWVSQVSALLAAGVMGESSLRMLQSGSQAVTLFHLQLPAGVQLFMLDRFNCLFLLGICLAALPVFLSSLAILTKSRDAAAGVIQNLLFFIFVCLLLSNNYYCWICGWELYSLCTFHLMASRGQLHTTSTNSHEALNAARASTLMLLTAFLVMDWGKGSGSIQLWETSHFELGPHLRSIVFLLLFFGYGIKTGLLPFYKIAVKQMSALPVTVSSLVTGMSFAAAIYQFLRIGFGSLFVHSTTAANAIATASWVSSSSWWGWIVCLFGAATAAGATLSFSRASDPRTFAAVAAVAHAGAVWTAVGAFLLYHTYGLFVLVHIPLSAVFLLLLNLSAGPLFIQLIQAVQEHFSNRLRTWISVLYITGGLTLILCPGFAGFSAHWLLLQSLLLVPYHITKLGIQAVCLAAAAAELFGMTLLGIGLIRTYGAQFIGKNQQKHHASPPSRLFPVLWCAVLLTLLEISLIGIGIGANRLSRWIMQVVLSVYPAMKGFQEDTMLRSNWFEGSSYTLSSISGSVIVLVCIGIALAGYVLYDGSSVKMQVKRVSAWNQGGSPAPDLRRMQVHATVFQLPFRLPFINLVEMLKKRVPPAMQFLRQKQKPRVSFSLGFLLAVLVLLLLATRY